MRETATGTYVGDLIPSKAGEYRFHLLGTIGDLAVDERFESGPGRFDPVTSPARLQFPDQVGSSTSTARELLTLRESAAQTRIVAIAGLPSASWAWPRH